MKDDDYVLDNPQRIYIEKRMNVFLNYNTPDNHKELITFKKRLIKYRNYLFTFLYHPKVPPDNNASERGIRNIKVKMKVSNQFKSYEFAQHFAVIRSVVDTTIKNGQDVFNALTNLANQELLAAE
ncbi:MAG: transposase [Bacteroidota bacterium]|nr:transposase [Bacteroidota bacterium]